MPRDLANTARRKNSPGRGQEAVKGPRWWALASLGRERMNDLRTSVAQLYTNPRRLPLTRRQRKLLGRNPGTLLAVAQGARMAIEECQFQFRYSRWSCPTLGDGSASVFGRIVQRGFRETAFIYAITSAGVSHAVARACSEGALHTCSCGGYRVGRERTPRGEQQWEWSGCSDNVDFGVRFSRRFVDVVERGRDFRYLMNLHNNHAGRVHVKRGMQKECKCHGMSGSCAIRTCWMRLSPFRHVGRGLRDRYDGATRVLPGNEGNVRTQALRRRKRPLFQPADPRHKPPTRRDLVYFDTSPSFCHRDVTLGFRGTGGRECNVSSMGTDGCDLMCCGRGFESQTYVARERCSCTFHWCCQVRCHVCSVTKTRHTCKG
ncbi:protein Wnt-1-like [Babylonia areolata]|uniref:protein Wnt-1-like n=1 Tax=Babylonia areolata TaxID=304850 RepID=UPI003FD2AD01